MLVEAIQKVAEQQHLTKRQAEQAMEEIMNGEATAAQIASFLTALRMKGETIDEISGFAKTMRAKANCIKPGAIGLVDTCGTGGDMSYTFNISTTVAFVVAGAGVPVAKHGNRSVSSKSGSADVLEALGVKLDLTPEQVQQCIDEIGIGFMFAPAFHGAMKHAIGPRREIGIRTVFNILGPLTNPAGATAHVLGVYDKELTEIMAHVLANLGVKRALVVHGHDGLDELTVTDASTISELADGNVTTYTVCPEDFGIERVMLSRLRGGDAAINARITRTILQGKRDAKRDVVELNAAAAFIAHGRAKDFYEGLLIARESIDSGNAMHKLEELVRFTQAAAASTAQQAEVAG